MSCHTATMTNGCVKIYASDSIVKTVHYGDRPPTSLVVGLEVLAYDGGTMVIESLEVTDDDAEKDAPPDEGSGEAERKKLFVPDGPVPSDSPPVDPGD